jgi:hypothetical protein
MACNDDGSIALKGEDLMKIVAINGSPRKDGNTAKLLKKATEDHKDTDLVYYDLVDMRIKDCIACMHCKKHNECSIKDDMTQIYRDREDNNAPRMSTHDHINRTAICRLAAGRYQYNPRYSHHILNA